MRIVEILLPKGTSDKSLSPQTKNKIDALQKRMTGYVDKICDPKTSKSGKEFLKAHLKTDYDEFKAAIKEIAITEAVNKLPLTDDDFEVVKKVMENPIPAAVASIYLMEIMDDDEFNDQIKTLEDTEPNRDIRPLVAAWFDRVMPDQMHRFGQPRASENERKGLLSPIHGYDPKMYKGSNEALTGNAFGRF
jgi:hypothetical protein